MYLDPSWLIGNNKRRGIYLEMSYLENLVIVAASQKELVRQEAKTLRATWSRLRKKLLQNAFNEYKTSAIHLHCLPIEEIRIAIDGY